MKIGFIGLGRMGSNMVLNLLEHKHEVIVYNRSQDKMEDVIKKGAIGTNSIKELIDKLPRPKIIWLMVSAGRAVDEVISEISPYLNRGDIVIDGGNSYFQDSLKRYGVLKKNGIHFIDCGTSGGISGARFGACMMIGGDREAFSKIEPLLKDMCVKEGYGYIGKTGSGHFVKMVHNGIEYGMMAAIAEGMQSIKEIRPDINLKEVAKVYSNGSIVESKLMSWTSDSYNRQGYLDSISGSVPKGETEQEMEKLENMAQTKMKILGEARMMRVNSRKKPNYAGKLVSAMRNQFGGHSINKESEKILVLKPNKE